MVKSRPSRDPVNESRPSCYPVKIVLALGCVFFAWRVAWVPQPPPLEFTDVTDAAGIGGFRLVCGGPSKDYILESMSGGAAFIDFDNDGWLDIYLVNGSTLEDARGGRPGALSRLYRNRGDGTFEDVTERSGAGLRGWGMAVCAADVDGNGWADLYVTNYGRNVLLLNNGDGTFRAAERGIASGGWNAGAAFADVDRDGDLDLYVARYLEFDLHNPPPPPGGNPLCSYRGVKVQCGPRGLRPLPDVFYRQEKDGVFVEATRVAGMQVGPYFGLGVVWGDANNDGWCDLYVANDSTPNLLFVNRKDGTFSEIGVTSGVALSAEGREQAGMGVDFGDYDNDGWLDIYVTNFSHDYNTLYRNLKDGFFADVSAMTGHAQATFPYVGWGTAFADFNNDGWLDLFVANGHVYPQVDSIDIGTRYRQRPQVFLNLKGKSFVEAGERAGLTMELLGRGAAFGDYDNDGDIDVLINDLDGRPLLLRNDSRNRNHWIELSLAGDGRNRSAIGARVEVQSAGSTLVREIKSGGSYLSQSDLRVHFGLGASTVVGRVRVRWPEGNWEEFSGVAADRFWSLRKGAARAVPARTRQ